MQASRGKETLETPAIKFLLIYSMLEERFDLQNLLENTLCERVYAHGGYSKTGQSRVFRISYFVFIPTALLFAINRNRISHMFRAFFKAGAAFSRSSHARSIFMKATVCT